jgi:hypothetical protein
LPEVPEPITDGLETGIVGGDGEITLPFGVELVGEVDGAREGVDAEDSLQRGPDVTGGRSRGRDHGAELRRDDRVEALLDLEIDGKPLTVMWTRCGVRADVVEEAENQQLQLDPLVPGGVGALMEIEDFIDDGLERDEAEGVGRVDLGGGGCSVGRERGGSGRGGGGAGG